MIMLIITIFNIITSIVIFDLVFLCGLRICFLFLNVMISIIFVFEYNTTVALYELNLLGFTVSTIARERTTSH